MVALSAENWFQEESLYNQGTGVFVGYFLAYVFVLRYKRIFDTISVMIECDEICPEFTMHYSLLLCFVCALSDAQLSEQNPDR